MNNIIDAVIAAVSPSWGLRRLQSRAVLSYYESARKDKQRKQRTETRSANSAIAGSGKPLRDQARHLEQNHDLARGVLGVLSANITGPQGIQIEPQPRNADGSINADASRQILELWRDWSRRPEVTWRHDWASTQRIACRAWLRDGEVLANVLGGERRDLQHGTKVPLSIELIESDYLPFDLNDADRRIVQGIEQNGWGRPTAYHLYKQHPGELGAARTFQMTTRRKPASDMLHVAMRDRIHQTRGVSVFASVLARLDDLKDYEDSERIAAKVAASMAAYIRKGTPDLYATAIDGEDTSPNRDMRFHPGMIFDDLLPGEDVGTIDTQRPNSNLESHRQGQLRAVAAGTHCSYSSLSKDYNGSYSSQRQELVESWGIYSGLQSEWTAAFVRPLYERFISAALATPGLLRIPAGVSAESMDDAIYIGPQMPWIDPKKEAEAWTALEQAGHASGPEIIRRRGANPRDVLEQETLWRDAWRDNGETITADPAAQNESGEQINDSPSSRTIRQV